MLGGAAAAMLLLAGCGSEAEGEAPAQGYERLTSSGITVDYPTGWKALSGADRPEAADAAAVLERDGRKLGQISVVVEYDDSRDAGKAAASALGDHELRSKIEKFKDSEVSGTDDGQRINYSFEGTGAAGSPPKGEPVNGVDVVGTDKSGETFLVRINATESALSSDELEKVVETVRVVDSE
ncbi:hypothetical protein ACFVW8_13040 [Streptomyces sp. NPDC058221]|uniref:hypothetical protein n=1 Tax=Streptomyces sp. NPDC058221 TaxID=3346388 RepID=UPI0036E4C0FE